MDLEALAVADRRGGTLGVPDRGRVDPGDRRHRLAPERDRGVLTGRRPEDRA